MRVQLTAVHGILGRRQLATPSASHANQSIRPDYGVHTAMMCGQQDVPPGCFYHPQRHLENADHTDGGDGNSTDSCKTQQCLVIRMVRFTHRMSLPDNKKVCA